MVVPATRSSIRAWKPRIEGIREVFHATFADHAYPPHTHDVWTLFIVDDGAIRYDLDGHPHGARPAMVTILPPHVVHDGRAATGDGFRKRVLYLETEVIGEPLVGPAVDRPVVPDAGLHRRVAALHDALERPDDALEAETRLLAVAARIRTSLGAAAPEPSGTPGGELAEQLRAVLDAHVFEPLTMRSAAATVGVDPTHLARAFSATFGIPPHAYVLGRRLEAARDRILGGQALADVAAEVGFYDQAHLSRHFKRFLGTTPSRFSRSGAAPGGDNRRLSAGQ